MKPAIRWMKTNPISVVSIFLIVLTLGYAFFWLRPQINTYRQNLSDRSKDLNQLKSLQNTSIQLPPATVGGADETYQMIPNDAVLASVRQIYDAIRVETSELLQFLNERNKAGHAQLIPNLFPQMTGGASTGFRAYDAYLSTFEQMLGPVTESAYTNENVPPARLNAGMPPSAEEITRALNQVASDISSRGIDVHPRTNQEIDEAQQQLLREQQLHVLKNLIIGKAQQIHIYANRPQKEVIDDTTGQIIQPATSIQQASPFHIVARSNQPTVDEIWEHQMNLWMQQDMVRAISLANDVENPQVNVLSAPIKRLVSIEVPVGEYVGLATISQSGAANRGAARQTPTDAPVSQDVTGTIPPNWQLSPTGRFSNPLYDVRHMTVVMVVDFRRLGEVFDAIHSVNFMTVINMSFKDVDEYAELHQGYMYGHGDMVEVTMKIETVWLREWINDLMPPSVKEMLTGGAAGVTGGTSGSYSDDDT